MCNVCVEKQFILVHTNARHRFSANLNDFDSNVMHRYWIHSKCNLANKMQIETGSRWFVFWTVFWKGENDKCEHDKVNESQAIRN